MREAVEKRRRHEVRHAVVIIKNILSWLTDCPRPIRDIND